MTRQVWIDAEQDGQPLRCRIASHAKGQEAIRMRFPRNVSARSEWGACGRGDSHVHRGFAKVLVDRFVDHDNIAGIPNGKPLSSHNFNNAFQIKVDMALNCCKASVLQPPLCLPLLQKDFRGGRENAFIHEMVPN